VLLDRLERPLEATIRPAKPGDIGRIQRIEASTYADPWPRALFHLMLERAPGLFLVAASDGDVVGYAVGEVEVHGGSSAGHVMNLAVEGPWRRRGVGQVLLEELEARLRGRGVLLLFLEVRESNLPAQSLYLKNGYGIVGRLPGYYGGEDGLVMEKRVGQIR
jgi:ribosomal-protein-alanine N-acetyltransferase